MLFVLLHRRELVLIDICARILELVLIDVYARIFANVCVLMVGVRESVCGSASVYRWVRAGGKGFSKGLCAS